MQKLNKHTKKNSTTGKLRHWDCQANFRISWRITDDKEMDTVERQTPSKTKKAEGSREGAGFVEAPDSPWSE
jgi:uncharacterized protein (DUF1684 family)